MLILADFVTFQTLCHQQLTMLNAILLVHWDQLSQFSLDRPITCMKQGNLSWPMPFRTFRSFKTLVTSPHCNLLIWNGGLLTTLLWSFIFWTLIRLFNSSLFKSKSLGSHTICHRGKIFQETISNFWKISYYISISFQSDTFIRSCFWLVQKMFECFPIIFKALRLHFVAMFLKLFFCKTIFF